MLKTALAGDLRRDHAIPGHISDAATLLVHEGDLDADGSIELDWHRGWDTGAIIEHLALLAGAPFEGVAVTAPENGVSGLLVTGSLRLTGALVNASRESGATLIVRGNLTARQASCGGACIHIGGDTRVEDVLYAHYNDGELHIGGTLVAKALINDDHLVSIGSGSTGQPSKKLIVITMRDLEDLEDDERVPKALQRVVGKSPLTLASILEGLRHCRPTSSLGKPQTPGEWKGVIWQDPRALRKLPKDLRTEEMYLSLLAGDCTLAEPEIHELVANIPRGVLSEAVRMAAFRLSPKSLLRLPADVDLHLEYARCLRAVDNPASVVGDIPAQFVPADWQR